MDDTEICRLCAEALQLAVTPTPSGEHYWLPNSTKRFDPLTNAKQAAQVRWRLLELGYEITQDAKRLIISFTGSLAVSLHDCRTVSDEYRLLAETLARHQKEEQKNG